MPLRFSLFLVGLIFTRSVAAEISFTDNWGAGLYVDQDLAVPILNEDRDYTMGIAAEFFWQDKDAGLYPLDGTVKRIGQWLGLHEQNDKIVRSFMLGSITYTPDDLSDPNPIHDDRPYASLIYLSNKRVRVNRQNATGIELQVGMLGLDYSGNIQTSLHQFYRDHFDDPDVVDPKGWDHQISDGGEFTLRLRMSNSRLLLETPRLWDISHTWSATVGYHTNLSIGLSGRLGGIASSPWTLPFDPINRGNFLPALTGNEWYGWVSYRLRLVAYDALLQGQLKESDVTFDWDEIRHVIHEGGIGMTYTYQPIQLTIAVNGKTPELKTGNSDRNHYWGGMYFVYRY